MDTCGHVLSPKYTSVSDGKHVVFSSLVVKLLKRVLYCPVLFFASALKNMNPTQLFSPKKTRHFAVFEPLSYTACSQNNTFTFYPLGHFREYLFIFLACLQCIKCSHMCKRAYLVFPSVYSVLEHHWIYYC